MDAKESNREKMQWLNAISLECEVNSTAFRVAYLIADHHNRVAGFAWPSLSRLAEQICLSSKSVQRAVGQLERMGWLEVDRKRERSNHYRMSWPTGRKPSLRKGKAKETDKIVAEGGQDCSLEGDKNVRQSYLNKYPRTFSGRLGEGKQGVRFNDRGRYEMEIVRRYGDKMVSVLETLNEVEPRAVDNLCRKERDGRLTPADIAAARLTAAQRGLRER
ncbi:helix-turn-helix domain-containing protein [Bradyrhizobium murdochi]|uniref:helix-turn-helix domain-containing protein n=1 Tax=Bradyrhizobium murdochi TaxID=1038859 RepID=UPI0004814B63|nr:helix-turn-helix domain-containing protein [Bradyrhizobium murdochi]